MMSHTMVNGLSSWSQNSKLRSCSLAVLCRELNLSPGKIDILNQHYDHWTQAVDDKFGQLKKVADGRHNQWITKACTLLQSEFWDTVNSLRDQIETCKICLLDFEDPDYPPDLKHLSDYPLVLYYQGNPNVVSRNSNFLTVVGSRNTQSYSVSALNLLLRPVCHFGIGTISGLAIGTDAMAHRIALENNAPTVAVIGSGLDEVSFYPSQNLSLKEQILESDGLVLSEYGPGVKATQYSFPRRNRILAALSSVTVVIQASHKSGSLITAKMALDIGRTVATIPASINNNSFSGNIALLKDGAIVLSEPEDILSLLNLSKKAGTEVKADRTIELTDEIEQRLYRLLQDSEWDFDRLCNRMLIDSRQLSSVLTLLELKGYALQTGDNMWSAV